MTRRGDGLPRWLSAAVVGLTVLPVAADLVLSDRRRVFGYLAADAFYYLTVARNLAETGRSTFDGLYLTNGYHPLWQLATAGLYGLLGEPSVLVGIVLVGLTCVAIAMGSIASLVPDGRWSRALAPLLPIGPTALALVPVWLHLGPEGVLRHSWQGRGRPLPGTAWAAMNGMESAFVLLAFAAASWLWIRRSPATSRRDGALLGLALSAMTLSRLDHGLVAVALLIPTAIAAARSRRFGPALATGVAFAVPIVTYLAVNVAVFGHALPVSGRLKSTFPSVTSSTFDAVAALAGPTPPTFWLPFAVRVALIAVPAAFAVLWLATAGVRAARGRTRPETDAAARFDAWLGAACVGVLALAAYDVLFVPLQHQGHWYFPVSTMTAALVMVRIPGRARPQGRDTLLVGVVGGTAAVLAAGAFGLHRTPHNSHLAAFYYDVAPALREHYAEPPRLVSYDDGIVAFSTGFPTMSGLGFTLDDEAVTALAAGRLLELAHDRGFDRVTSLVYFPPWALGPDVGSNIDALAGSWPVATGGARPPFDFSLDYRTEDGGFVILRIRPR